MPPRRFMPPKTAGESCACGAGGFFDAVLCAGRFLFRILFSVAAENGGGKAVFAGRRDAQCGGPARGKEAGKR